MTHTIPVPALRVQLKLRCVETSCVFLTVVILTSRCFIGRRDIFDKEQWRSSHFIRPQIRIQQYLRNSVRVLAYCNNRISVNRVSHRNYGRARVTRELFQQSTTSQLFVSDWNKAHTFPIFRLREFPP